MRVVGYFWTLLECMHDRCMHTDRHVWIVTMTRSTCNFNYYFWTTAPYFMWSWGYHSGQSRLTRSMLFGACGNICLACQSFWEEIMKYNRTSCMWGMDAPKKITHITWEGNSRRCSRHRGSWGGSRRWSLSHSSLELFDATHLGLMFWYIYIYACKWVHCRFFSQEGGGGLRCLDLLINAACWTSHRIHSHQVQASFKSLFGHHCPRKL